MPDTSEDPYVPSQRSVHAAGGPMGWSTKVAIGGVIHGSQVNRHPPHHPPSSYSLVGARLKHFSLIVRLYGFEGEAGREGEGFTRIPESSYRRLPRTVWKNGVSRTVGFDWPVGVAVAHQQASFDAAGAPDAPM